MKELAARSQPVCDVLPHTEFNFMVKTFGENVYQELLDDLVDTSAATVWQDSTDYVLDDIVIHEGIYYKLIVANSTLSDTPNCNSEWATISKFNKTCFNELWSTAGGGLSKLLSWVIFAEAVPFYPNIMGLTDFIGDDKEYQNKINYYRANIYKQIAIMEKMLWAWNKTSKCIQVYVCDTHIATDNQASFSVSWD